MSVSSSLYEQSVYQLTARRLARGLSGPESRILILDSGPDPDVRYVDSGPDPDVRYALMGGT